MIYTVAGMDFDIPDSWNQDLKNILINSANEKAEFVKLYPEIFNDPLALTSVKALFNLNPPLSDGTYRAEIEFIMETWNSSSLKPQFVPWEYFYKNIQYMIDYEASLPKKDITGMPIQIDPKARYKALKSKYIKELQEQAEKEVEPVNSTTNSAVIQNFFTADDYVPDNVETLTPEYLKMIQKGESVILDGSNIDPVDDEASQNDLQPSTVTNALATTTSTETTKKSTVGKVAAAGVGVFALWQMFKD